MQHEAHPGLPDYGEVSSRERALEQYAQDLHRREIQLMRDRIHKKPVGGGPTLGNAPGRRAAGAERVQAARAAAFEGDADGLLLSGGAASPRARETTFGRTAREVTAPVARPEPLSPAEIRDADDRARGAAFNNGTRAPCGRGARRLVVDQREVRRRRVAQRGVARGARAEAEHARAVGVEPLPDPWLRSEQVGDEGRGRVDAPARRLVDDDDVGVAVQHARRRGRGLRVEELRLPRFLLSWRRSTASQCSSSAAQQQCSPGRHRELRAEALDGSLLIGPAL